MKTGIELMAIKRERQISKHGYDKNHDSQHEVVDFLDAAYAYMYKQEASWPFADGFKLSSDVENLTNAGAMIAAAVDLIQSQNSNHD